MSELQLYCGPVWFKSRTLRDPEARYPILQRELLAVVYAFDEFYPFVFGTKVKVLVDHQPLVPIIKRGLEMATATDRVQRYLVRLAPFHIVLIYLPGKNNGLADFPSRFPRSDTVQSGLDREEEEDQASIVNTLMDGCKINHQMLIDRTAEDSVLLELRKAIGTQDFVKVPQFRHVAKDLNFSENGALITMNGRIIVPSTLQQAVADVIHEGHVGVVRMKQLARRYFYWPGLNRDLEKLASACLVCKQFNPDRQPKHFVPWPEATRPFQRAHIDFFHKDGVTLFLLIDAYSRWVSSYQ